MKHKIYQVLLIGLMIFALSACSVNHDKKETEITMDKSSFEATVREKADHAILVEPDETSDEIKSVSYTHLRAHETVLDLVCRLLLEKKKEIKKVLEKINKKSLSHRP